MGTPDVSSIDRFLEGINARDVERVRVALAPDFVFEEVAGAGSPSVEALVEELRMIFAAFPDITFRPVRRTNDGGRTYVEFKAIGTHRGEFLNVPATGATAIVSGVFNIGGDGSGIRRFRMTVDFGGLRRQLLMAARMQ